MTTQAERPRFYEQQYLGADDLAAVVDYGRRARARHDLGAHSWGIGAGLQIVERSGAGAAGSLDVYIQPGYAWDGFGRPLVLLESRRIPAERFTMPFDPAVHGGTPAGEPIPVWLRYRETPTGGPPAGFEVCAAEDQFGRTTEEVDIVVGPRTHLSQHDSITVGGFTGDAQNILRALGTSADPLLEDESVPYQTFPEDWGRALWLIPIGIVRWLPSSSGGTGSFVARDPADLDASERFRRYAGVIAETVDASRGFVRVRDRTRSYAPPVWKKPAADNETDLLWVEGSLRVLGDARVLGGKVMWRDQANSDQGVPLSAARDENNGLVDAGGVRGRDLRLHIGAAEAGLNRLAVGPLIPGAGTAPPTFKPRLVVKDNGMVGVGSPDPQWPLTVRGQETTEELVGFETFTGNPTWHVNHLALGLNVVETTAAASRLYLQPGGNVGVGTTAPGKPLTVRARGGTEELLGFEAPDGTLKWHMNQLAAGSGLNLVETDPALSRLFIQAGGRIGIGTTAPSQQLHVVGALGVRQNELYLSGGSGWSSISYNAHHDAANTAWVYPDPTRVTVTVEMDDAGGQGRFEVFSSTTASRTTWVQRLAIAGETGNVLMAHNGGNVGVGTPTPGAKLHVRNAIVAGPFASNSAVGAINATGESAELGFSRRDLAAWPAVRVAGDRYAWYSANGSSAQLWTEATGNILTITNEGNVGIGTTAPINRLHVSGSDFGDPAQFDRHIAMIENTSANSTADVLVLRLGNSDPDDANNYITFVAASSVIGALEGNGAGAVVLDSPGADYAEWMPRQNAGEAFLPGEVVAVTGGSVSRSTEDASQFLAISTSPVVLGNRPLEGDRSQWERVALLGQVPIRTRGRASMGDYLVASGNDDGTAVAISPANMSVMDHARVIGVAWESKDGGDVRAIRASLGLQNLGAFRTVAAELDALRHELNHLRERDGAQSRN